MQAETVTDTTRDATSAGHEIRKTSEPKGAVRRLPVFFVSLVSFWLFALVLPAEVYDLARLGGQECSKPDLITGFIHLKNKKIVWKQEGFSAGSTNSFGFLDSEHQLAKPEGVCRIAMLGDSMTEALQVPQNLRFSNLLEERLNKEKTGRYEVMNFGISAAGSGQEYLTYLRYVEQFKPDITMLFYDSGDEDKNLRKPAASQWYPHAVFSLERGKLCVSWRDFDSWLHSAQAMPIVLFEDWRQRSHVWGAILQSFNALKSDIFFMRGCTYLERWKVLNKIEDLLVKCLPVSRYGPTDFRQSEDAIFAERGKFCSQFGLLHADTKGAAIPRFDRKDYEFGREAEYHTLHLTKEQTEKMQRQYRQRWQLALAILKNLSRECSLTGSKLIVVGFPAQLLKEGFAFTFSQIADSAREENFYAKDFTSDFDAQVQSRGITPRYVTHLTPSGHEVMARLLEKYLKEQDLLPQ